MDVLSSLSLDIKNRGDCIADYGPGGNLCNNISDNPSRRRCYTLGVNSVIVTLFKSQIILAEHECCTNWGDCKSNKSNQIKCWFLRRGENRSSWRKTSRSRVENQQTQPTYDAASGNPTRDTVVEGERSHHYTNPASQTNPAPQTLPFLTQNQSSQIKRFKELTPKKFLSLP